MNKTNFTIIYFDHISVAYIERDKKVTNGHQVRQFVLAIRNLSIANKLSTLTGHGKGLNFSIFPSTETKVK
jgi:hypothetical protein